MQETALIRDTTWARIRERFSEEEKAELRQHICGETICPRGFVVDLSKVAIPGLADKLKRARAEVTA
jgi:hypothetical protein